MGCFGRQVAGRNYPPINKNTLIRALTEEWDKLPQQLLDNVVKIVEKEKEVMIHFSARAAKYVQFSSGFVGYGATKAMIP
ncbi:hypothetical protein TNCV_512541 [Trichonephila clavipes]|nr:hypothetical protein TNCV_512541 [Trichonephila clavipes]